MSDVETDVDTAADGAVDTGAPAEVGDGAAVVDDVPEGRDDAVEGARDGDDGDTEKPGQRIKQLEAGQIMLVEATDGGSRSDIPSWAKDTGNELIESTSDDGVYRYLIRKK